MSENLFRIGGVYRNEGGKTVALVRIRDSFHKQKWESEFPGHSFALAEGVLDGYACGYVSLLNGRYVSAFERTTHPDHLIAGELHQINGAWAPIEDPELVALQTRPQHVEASCEEEKPASGLATLIRKEREKLEASGALERNRPPLPGYGQRTPFDPFSDFIVHHREEVSVNVKPFAGLSLDGCEQFKAPRAL